LTPDNGASTHLNSSGGKWKEAHTTALSMTYYTSGSPF
jgi:hypothetical protein